jgi:RNA polymerase sigma-70 factor (ECF subfamily)
MNYLYEISQYSRIQLAHPTVCIIVNVGLAAASGAQREDTRQVAWKQLVQRMADEDHSALSELYDLSSGILYSMALSIVRNPEDAEETLHDAYWRAWRYARAYSEQRGSVLAWLILMTRTSAIDRLRAGKRHRAVASVELCGDTESTAISPEDEVVSNQRITRIRAAMRRLPEEQREVIQLAFFRGLTHSELAEHLGVPLGTIKTRIRTGLLRMRGALEDLGT